MKPATPSDMPCPMCEGHGSCPPCHSTGRVPLPDCPACDGGGDVFVPETRGRVTVYHPVRCGACKGTGHLRPDQVH